MLMPRDREIKKFIEEQGSLTILQCQRIFFSDKKYGYEQARRRLKTMYEAGLIKCSESRNKITNEYIYYIDKILPPHDIMLTNFYSMLKLHKAQVSMFKTRPRPNYMNNKVRPDGLVVFDYFEPIAMFLEVDLTHKTDISKYQRLYDTGEVQKQLNGFPLVVIIGDEEKPSEKIGDIECIYIDYEMKNFVKKILLLQD